jgi:penicillin G amidase
MLIVPKSAKRAPLAPRLAGGFTLAGLLWLGFRGSGPLPPVGPLLEPWRGAWSLAVSANLPEHAEDSVRGLDGEVRVVYDDRAVPHIFAPTELDAIRALGYVTARDRLFQLDLQARAGGGTLTELLGPAALESDREVRRLGMARAAERLTGALADTSVERASLEAYAAGINAYMDGMPERDLPLEYRLLGRRPARWGPLRTVQVLLRMGYTLTQNQVELERAAAAGAVGDTAAAALFPRHATIQEPIQPSAGEPRRLPLTVPPPGTPDPAAAALAAVLPHSSNRPELGSNNWAVAPARTRNGAALLAGDPHLDLTLPSIWYEAHLVVPNALDEYGVTIPGLPTIVIGFTRDLAWSFTNAEADLMDRWVETVDDSVRPMRYRLDGAWVPLELRAEVYLGPTGDTISVDTLRFTHRGPLRRMGRTWISLRWTALEAVSQWQAFRVAAHAHTAQEWLDAMRSYASPPQNMLVADRTGTIAIRSTGRFPLRAGDGFGDRLLDGSTRASDWTGDWSVAEYPQAIAPAQGYLASANQEPQDPRDQPHYLGSDWLTPWRALRINQLLRSDSAATPETMQRWQTDVASPRADALVPYLLRAAAARPSDSLAQRAAALLGAWDRRYTLDNQAAVLFEAVLRALSGHLWDELPSDVSPSSAALLALLDDPRSPWWDVRTTKDRVEQRDDVLSAALDEGYVATVRAYGPAASGAWQWSQVHRIDIWHLLHLPALSRTGLAVPGGPSTLSPSSITGGSEGSSWRMVVELGSEVRAWGTYPGGQSGNPASARYDDRLSQWIHGELAPLRFPRRPADVPAQSELVLRRRR